MAAALLLLVSIFSFPLPLADDSQDLELEKVARELESKLIAPCCWRQPVSVHYSQASQEIKREIREMLATGKSSDAIVSHFVALHGERILAAPAYRGFGGFAYLLPGVFVILGALLVLVLTRRVRGGDDEPTSNAVDASDRDTSYLERLHREMWD